MNPVPIESRDIANNKGYQNDPVLGSEGVVNERIAIVAYSIGSGTYHTYGGSLANGASAAQTLTGSAADLLVYSSAGTFSISLSLDGTNYGDYIVIPPGMLFRLPVQVTSFKVSNVSGSNSTWNVLALY